MKKNIHCECVLEVKELQADMAGLYHPILERPYVVHKPHECKCTNDLRLYQMADGSIKYLCSCCCCGEPEVREN